MRKQYDDFTQMKPKEMSKAMSDMTYQYINPETDKPTIVPSAHYEKILDRIVEQYLGDITDRQFLTIIYSQLTNMKKENEKYFLQALLCLDLGLNPKDLRINEQVALYNTFDYIQERQKLEKKDFHFLNSDFVNYFKESLDNPELQANAVKNSNLIEEIEQNNLNSIKKQYYGYNPDKDNKYCNHKKYNHDRER